MYTNEIHRLMMDGEPFIVYAVDSPTYPEMMFGCRYDIQSEQPAPYEFTGSAILISGGVYKLVESAGAEVPLIWQDGVHLRFAEIREFAERVLTSLVGVDDRVTILYGSKYTLRNPERMEKAGRAGFQVHPAEDGDLCIGTGSSLRVWNQLERVFSFDDFTLIASSEPESALEMSLLEAAAESSSIKSTLHGFWDRVQRSPDTVAKELGGYGLIAAFCGPDGNNIIINQRRADVTGLETAFGGIAADLNMPLYCAGGLSQPDRYGRSFAQFSYFLRLGPLPSGWTRVR